MQQLSWSTNIMIEQGVALSMACAQTELRAAAEKIATL